MNKPLSHLQRLEAEAIFIMREVVANFERPVMLYSIGKDSSVMLHLARKAFYPAPPPFPLLHVDTTWKFRDMISFRDETARKYDLKLIVHTNEEGRSQGINPFDHGSSHYTQVMKTQALKQALDLGAYGIVWPHVSTAEQAYNAVSACLYPTMKDHPLHEPFGQRGDGPHGAVRFWGLSQQEYYKKADVWPLNPEGEIFVMLMIEDLEGIQNLREMLTKVKGIGAVLIGEGDLSQELGYPRQYEHKVVLEHMAEIVRIATECNVVVGHPHVGMNNVERVLSEGYRFLMAAPERSYNALNKGREIAGR